MLDPQVLAPIYLNPLEALIMYHFADRRHMSVVDVVAGLGKRLIEVDLDIPLTTVNATAFGQYREAGLAADMREIAQLIQEIMNAGNIAEMTVEKIIVARMIGLSVGIVTNVNWVVAIPYHVQIHDIRKEDLVRVL